LADTTIAVTKNENNAIFLILFRLLRYGERFWHHGTKEKPRKQ